MVAHVFLHPRLAEDSHVLGTMGDTIVLLHRNSTLHWFMLVPSADVLDLTDLPAAIRSELLDYAARIANVLKGELGYSRVNIGALGLVVPQLHLHVIGRREDDPCWPAPVWGVLPAGLGYSDGELQALQSLLLLR